MQNVFQRMILLILIVISSNIIYAESNWTRVGTTPNGKPIMLSPTGSRYVSNYSEPFGGNYRSSVPTNGLIRGSNGVVSAGTVRANIVSTVPKKTVFRHVLNNARTYGKMGLRRAGWLGMAYSLAEMALRAKGYNWSDEKGDFVREDDDNTYIVFVTENENAWLYSAPSPMTDNKYDEFCKDKGCRFLGLVKSQESGREKGLNYCRTVMFGGERNGDSITSTGLCATQNGFWVSFKKVHIVKYTDFVPITQEEFDEIVEPIADANPSKWVESSKPSEDADVPGASKPKVTVFDGEIAQSPPYTDPTTGKAQQTRWEFKTPTSGEPTVSEFIIPRPDLTPNSPEAPAVDGKDIPDDVPDDDNPADGKDKDEDKDKEQQEQFDLCKEHPDIMACDKQPDTPDDKDFEIPHETHDLLFAPDTLFPSQGICPAPVSFSLDFPYIGSKSFQFDTMPICETASRLRGFIIAMAWLIVATMCLRALSSKD